MKSLFTLILTSVTFFQGFAQCLQYPVSLNERINAASIIVEGKITDAHSIWNEDRSHIVTVHTIEIYKILKANTSDLKTASVKLLTPGGVIADMAEKVSPSLEPHINDYGIYFLNDYTEKGLYEPYSGPQACIKMIGNSGTDVFSQYNDIENEVYALIKMLSGMEAVVIKEKSIPISAFRSEVPLITGFSPSSVSAGTQTTLTINGSGFGALQGNGIVSFKDADNGGSTTVETETYVSWADNQIQVKVPSGAGTGKIIVSNNAGQNVTSVSSVSIPFSHLNVEQIATDLINKNGSGGYTFSYFTGFNSNTPAKEAYERALKTWGCNTKLNFSIGATNSSDAVDRDGMNVVRFDNGSFNLPPGVLGVTINYFTGCLTNVWYSDEMDMVYDDNTNWNFGPTAAVSGKFDFESVVLHELGHAHQLGHVIDATKVMHFSIGTGSNKRSLNSEDISGGLAVISRSKSTNICGPGPTTDKTQTGCNTGIDDIKEQDKFAFGPNPYTGGTFTVSCQNDNKEFKIRLFDIMGKEVYHSTNSEKVIELSSVLSELSTGVYLLSFEFSGGIESHKIQVIK